MTAGRAALARYLRATRAFARCTGDPMSVEFLGAARDRARATTALAELLWLGCEEIESARHLAKVGPDSQVRVIHERSRGGTPDDRRPVPARHARRVADRHQRGDVGR